MKHKYLFIWIKNMDCTLSHFTNSKLSRGVELIVKISHTNQDFSMLYNTSYSNSNLEISSRDPFLRSNSSTVRLTSSVKRSRCLRKETLHSDNIKRCWQSLSWTSTFRGTCWNVAKLSLTNRRQALSIVYLYLVVSFDGSKKQQLYCPHQEKILLVYIYSFI